MLSSADWAILVIFRKELEALKALYIYPRADIQTVIIYMEKRIKDIEMKQNDS
jgi:hypothetical protein